MTNILLDTHALLWSFMQVEKLSDKARSAIEQADNVLVSSVSLHEIALKQAIGKLALNFDLDAAMKEASFSLLPFNYAATQKYSLVAAQLDNHRDPFDRALIAHALALDVALVSVDSIFLEMPGLQLVW